MTKNSIRQLFREDIIRESVIYQDILEQGVQQGQQQALKTSILDALDARFGSVPAEVAPKLEGLTPEQLQGLLRQAVLCGTLDAFIRQLG
ncbi:MAG: hypothetical protein MUC60_04310 [Oscillatoria sp. Prado101]|nr:hypothetical protein [Oscillatoria sp. Prado101]